jgi:hypothetical protein
VLNSRLHAFSEFERANVEGRGCFFGVCEQRQKFVGEMSVNIGEVFWLVCEKFIQLFFEIFLTNFCVFFLHIFFRIFTLKFLDIYIMFYWTFVRVFLYK